MGSADVNLKVDQQDRLLFAHSPMRALVFAVIAGGFAWASWHYSGDAGAFRYAFTGFAMLFVVIGVLGVFWRLELDIDLSTRSVRLRRGFWPATKSTHRSLDEAEGVVLRMEYRSSGSKGNKRKVPWWFVGIQFPEEEKATRIFATTKEVDAYEKWEYFAKRLKLDAINATEPAAVERKGYRELDAKLSSQSPTENAERPRRDPTPPQGSGLEVRFDGHQKEIVIPAVGFSGGLVFLFLFGATFAAMGTLPLLAQFGILDIEVSGSDAVLAIVPPIFILAGLGIIWLGIKGSYSTMHISVRSGELVTEIMAFGRRSGHKSVVLANVESVGISGDVQSRRRKTGHIKIGGVAFGNRGYQERKKEIVVRADGGILRFGRSLNDAARIWLGNACRYAVVHGQLP
jgi:hypothetical protein